ncbi:MAG: hypothetical protein L0332_03270 [Chloroflexi bacterium]|nr:hypothetical protein [Chloroflexota bacterium]MCI0645876.1 hypothetical protein [Chloroflexota bacterium]MCI0725731.1 hypothetical protein [Chloroflexota bacterium]
MKNSTQLLQQIGESLQSAGIKAAPKAKRILEAYKRDTLAIDDAVLIIAPSDLKGWMSPSQFMVTLSQDDRLLNLPSLSELEKQYGFIRKPQRNESKFTILHWEQHCVNDEWVLELQMGRSSTEVNVVIEFMIDHPVLEISPGRHCTLYEAYLTKIFDFWTHLPNLVTVTPVIKTLDNKVLFTKRSAKVFYYPAHWEVSISEQMNPNQLSDKRFFFHGAIERSIREELGQVEISQIQVLGFYREVSNLNVDVGALVMVNEKENEIRKAIAAAPDLDEHSNIEFEPWNPENSVQLISSTHYKARSSSALSGPYHPSARMRLLLAMLADFPHETLLSLINQQ